SSGVSASSIHNILDYNGANAVAYLYDRGAERIAPKLGAIIDDKDSKLMITDMAAFEAIISRENSYESPEKVTAGFLKQAHKKGFSIVLLKDQTPTLSLDAAGVLRRQDRGVDIPPTIKQLITKEIVGDITIPMNSAVIKRALG